MRTWERRDLPVLRWLQSNPPEHELLMTNWMDDGAHPDVPELNQREVHVAVEVLADEGLISYGDITFEGGGGVIWTQFQVSGAGLQALGEWPTFEVLDNPDQLGSLLESLADMAATDDEEQNLREAAMTVKSKSREALQSITAGILRALVRSQIG